MLILGKVNYSDEWQLLRQYHPSQATRPQPPSSPDSPAPQRVSPTPLCVSLIPHCQHLTTPEGTTTHQKEEVKINQICFSMSNFCSTEIWQSLQFNLLNKRDIRSRNSQNREHGSTEHGSTEVLGETGPGPTETEERTMPEAQIDLVITASWGCFGLLFVLFCYFWFFVLFWLFKLSGGKYSTERTSLKSILSLHFKYSLESNCCRMENTILSTLNCSNTEKVSHMALYIMTI